ncbi:MAG: rRNA maturation RNase YbeY [Candidatus Omnitrophica bacterium]|nr:rRNA maturation RNase YbeY [Candidatus Omnitrophota bacterium]
MSRVGNLKLEIINSQKKIPVVAIRIKKLVLKALSEVCLKRSAEITVCFVDDKRMKELNYKFHHRNSPTDVLAFDLSLRPGKEIIADIVVSAETAKSNAKEFGTTPGYELELYVVHGVLHLLGYKDATVRQREQMQVVAERIIASLK